MTTGQKIEAQLDELDSVKENLFYALASKGIYVDYDEKFETLISKVNTLKNPVGTKNITSNGSFDVTNYKTASVNIDTKYHWQRPSDWWDTATILQNARTKTNDAGETVYPIYIIMFDDTDDTISLYFRNNAGINSYGNGYLTSDGVWYGTNDMTHTWDRTQDKPCSLGYKTRYVIVYANRRDFPWSNPMLKLYDVPNVLEVILGNMTVNEKIWFCSVSSEPTYYKDYYVSANKSSIINFETLNSTKIRNVDLSGCVNLEHIKIRGTTASNYGFQVYAKYAINLKEIELDKTLSIGRAAFEGCESLEVVNAPLVTSLYEMRGTFYNCSSLKELSFPSLTTMAYYNSNAIAFSPALEKFSAPNLTSITTGNSILVGATGIKEVYCPKLVASSISNAQIPSNNKINKLILKNNMPLIKYFQYYPSNDNKYIDFSGVNLTTLSFSSMNISCFYLERFILPDNFKTSGLNFSNSYIPHKNTIIEILEKLADVTGESSTYTLTLGNKNLNKLTEEEKAIATNKGWTLN